MTIRFSTDRSAADAPVAQQAGKRGRTAHLKQVPPSLELREAIRKRCREVAAGLDKSHPLNKGEMERISRSLLLELDQSEGYLGWTMVALASEFWRDQVAAIPASRRLLLLPHCLKPMAGCLAGYDEYGLDCGNCQACSIADFRGIAEARGYRVLVVEGSPVVMNIIVNGDVDAIIGVACLNVLEKAIDKILHAGIPCMAVPLLSSDCRLTSVDDAWVREMIELVPRDDSPQPPQTRSYLHLMRAASRMFDPEELERIAPRRRRGPRLPLVNGQGLDGLDPVAATETLAYEFLAKGGKYSRPFITLAVYDAMTGGRGTGADGAEQIDSFPDSVQRTAMAIEAFHKASLVHDDIEDDDSFRYGECTLHRRYGTSLAINIGDFLIGLGYRLVSREAESLGPEVTADILDQLADAHARLAEGQGAELVWRDSTDMQLGPIDALKIYALKTAPAFEAALLTGIRLAGPADGHREPIRKFAKCLGIAFQIINDLNDWQADGDNKLSQGTDLLAGRPTLLWALAIQDSSTRYKELIQLARDQHRSRTERILRARQLYEEANAFDTAYRLIDKYETRANEIAMQIEPLALRRLFRYLVDTVLERPSVDSLVQLPWVRVAEPRALAGP